MARLLLLFLVFYHLVITAHGTERTVGGTGSSWKSHYGTSTFYQDWADSYSWNSGDVLYFNYNSDVHNVWVFDSYESYSTCDFTGVNLLHMNYFVRVTLTPFEPGSSVTLYFSSSKYSDCKDGVRFSLTYYTCYSCTDSLAPPTPPSRTSPSPPPPHVREINGQSSSKLSMASITVIAGSVSVGLVLAM